MNVTDIGALPAETRKQAAERRLSALEIHIQDLEDRFHAHLVNGHLPAPAWQWAGNTGLPATADITTGGLHDD